MNELKTNAQEKSDNRELSSESRELSSEELDAVSGGWILDPFIQQMIQQIKQQG